MTLLNDHVPGMGGASTLEVWKDRKGGVRVNCPPGRQPACGTFRLTPITGGLSWSITPPTGHEKPSLAAVAEGDADALAALDPPPESVADVKERKARGTDRAAAALRALRVRTSVPDTQVQVRGTECRECRGPLDDVLGTGVHLLCTDDTDDRKEPA